VSDTAEGRFLAIVTVDPTARAVLERAPSLGLDDRWLTLVERVIVVVHVFRGGGNPIGPSLAAG
jgi:hypothetical protein